MLIYFNGEKITHNKPVGIPTLITKNNLMIYQLHNQQVKLKLTIHSYFVHFRVGISLK